jgi:hypothetical protein
MELRSRSNQTEAAKRGAEGYLMRGRYVGGLTARRVIVCGAVLLAIQALALACLFAGAYGVVTGYGPTTVSFVAFYAARQLAADGHPMFAYDDVFDYEAEEAVTQQQGLTISILLTSAYLLR